MLRTACNMLGKAMETARETPPFASSLQSLVPDSVALRASVQLML